MRNGCVIERLLLRHTWRIPLLSPTRRFRTLSFLHTTDTLAAKTPPQIPLSRFPPAFLEQSPHLIPYFPSLTPRPLSTISTDNDGDEENSIIDEDPFQEEAAEEVETDGWEEEEDDDADAKVGDGGNGGGVVLQGIPWGQRVLSIAEVVLLRYGDDMKLFAFKTTPRGYVYVRLDKLSNQYGCPNMEELENYCQEYKKKLEEVGALGEIPDDLALEVSSPGAERILKVPDDLCRFKDMPMRVCYIEGEYNHPEKDGVFFLDSVEIESGNCVWKLADVKENRDPQSKGRALSRKMRDWRLNLPFEKHRRVTLYLEF